MEGKKPKPLSNTVVSGESSFPLLNWLSVPEQILQPFSGHNWSNAAQHTGGEAVYGQVLTNTDKLAKGVAVAKPQSSSEYSEWGCTLLENEAFSH